MEVNVEKIMEEIRAEIRARGLDASQLTFEEILPKKENSFSMTDDYNQDDLLQACEYLNHHYEVTVWHPLMSSRPLIGPVITFGKKVMRKLTRFFVQAIVEDQNSFNMHVTRSMNQIRNYVVHKNEKLEESDRMIDELLVRQSELNDRLKKLEEENADLKKKRADL